MLKTKTMPSTGLTLSDSKGNAWLLFVIITCAGWLLDSLSLMLHTPNFKLDTKGWGKPITLQVCSWQILLHPKTHLNWPEPCHLRNEYRNHRWRIRRSGQSHTPLVPHVWLLQVPLQHARRCLERNLPTTTPHHQRSACYEARTRVQVIGHGQESGRYTHRVNPPDTPIAPTQFFRHNWAIYKHEHDTHGSIVWDWGGARAFEFDIEYKPGYFYPLKNGHLPEEDKQGLCEFGEKAGNSHDFQFISHLKVLLELINLRNTSTTKKRPHVERHQ